MFSKSIVTNVGKSWGVNNSVGLKRKTQPISGCVLCYFKGVWKVKERGPEPRPLLQATILFHLRGHFTKS
ncbi:hypothetical protein CAP36_17940 [Chitinophagaceae bacterium IBVUCB2]|nr:hypothetical protein CAP36_17940 [Chitinophagaceae bacterium IBVUCB2]